MEQRPNDQSLPPGYSGMPEFVNAIRQISRVPKAAVNAALEREKQEKQEKQRSKSKKK